MWASQSLQGEPSVSYWPRNCIKRPLCGFRRRTRAACESTGCNKRVSSLHSSLLSVVSQLKTFGLMSWGGTNIPSALNPRRRSAIFTSQLMSHASVLAFLLNHISTFTQTAHYMRLLSCCYSVTHFSQKPPDETQDAGCSWLRWAHCFWWRWW